MATQRFNYSDKFKLNGKKVGISTSSPQENLDVASGTLKGVDLQSNSGITTFSTYEGFLNKKTTYTENVNIDTGVSGSLSGEIVVGAGLTVTVGTAATSGQGDVECLKVFNVFNPPCGGTANRPSAATPGTLYYNKDFKTIEYWDGNFWRQVDNTTRSGRGVFSGGETPTRVSTMDYITIASQGNAISFGNLTNSQGVLRDTSACSSSTRGIICTGEDGNTPRIVDIQYFTIASAGNSIDYGDLTVGTRGSSAVSSSTRGICKNGSTPSYPGTIDAFEISTLGNALDFGDQATASAGGGGASSPTRGIFGGGYTPTTFAELSHITISSFGNSVKFGELTTARHSPARGIVSNTTRGFIVGGSPSGKVIPIDTINFSTLGNAVDFGNLNTTRAEAPSGCSSSTRDIAAGGATPTMLKSIDYFTLSTSGSAENFGDLTQARAGFGGVSDSHGGLGGY